MGCFDFFLVVDQDIVLARENRGKEKTFSSKWTL